MKNALSIRSYTNHIRSHTHDYHQLVLPLNGSIDIRVEKYQGMVSVGDGVIVRSGKEHQFKAHEQARFIVADLQILPDNMLESKQVVFSLSAPLLAYIRFLEQQLPHHLSEQIEVTSVALFQQLLTEQSCHYRIDPRIEHVLAELHKDIAKKWSLVALANIACLSLTQFKVVFRQSVTMTPHQYITQIRMEKAKAMLVHTDWPVSIIAEKVGYQDVSAFSRRFSNYYGQPPSAFLRSYM
ncbi:AraC family transcriptional regulator [Marinomonas agarivorans]|nr:AraC family transcriptional regulator [Marinomonas agarivorans]